MTRNKLAVRCGRRVRAAAPRPRLAALWLAGVMEDSHFVGTISSIIISSSVCIAAFVAANMSATSAWVMGAPNTSAAIFSNNMVRMATRAGHKSCKNGEVFVRQIRCQSFFRGLQAVIVAA